LFLLPERVVLLSDSLRATEQEGTDGVLPIVYEG
jgi:hypothetical protein